MLAMDIKYVYTENGQEEAVLLPIEFWNDLLKHYNIEQEHYFRKKYPSLLQSIRHEEGRQPEKTEEMIAAVFSSWHSDETGDDLASSLYKDRQDTPKDIDL